MDGSVRGAVTIAVVLGVVVIIGVTVTVCVTVSVARSVGIAVGSFFRFGFEIGGGDTGVRVGRGSGVSVGRGGNCARAIGVSVKACRLIWRTMAPSNGSIRKGRDRICSHSL